MKKFNEFCSMLCLMGLCMVFVIFVACPILIKLNEWFFMPTTNYPITKLQIVGVLLLASLIRYKRNSKENKPPAEVWLNTIGLMFFWILTFGMAYLYKLVLG